MAALDRYRWAVQPAAAPVMMGRMELSFYYDIVCPYAFMASTRVEAIAARRGATVRWIPILLGGLFRHHDAPQQPASQMSAPRARLNALDIRRQGERFGLDLRLPDAHPRRTVSAMRLLIGAPEAVRPALSADLYRAYWIEGRDVSDRAVLAEIGARHGVDVACIDDPAVKQGLFDTTAEAAQRGAFGVPTIGLGERIFYGADRLHLVDAALGGPSGPQTREAAPATDVVLRVFHDFASPFSYLAMTQIERIARESGARIEWRPFLLGALFRQIGTPDVPLFEASAAKQRYLATDLRDWADWWGVPYAWPKHFPLRSILPLRVSLVDQRAMDPLYRAYWGEGRNISDPATCAAVLDAADLPGEALVCATQDPAIKATLKAYTDEARAAGLCGAPSIIVERPGAAPLLFWGQDRLDAVADAARGRQPKGG